MKGHDYVQLSSLFYNHKDEYEKLYEFRFSSNDCVKLDFMIGDNQAFFMETSELLKAALDISRIDKEVSVISGRLPGIALKQYIKKCLIDEILITNDIEGVYSTRKEIGELLDDRNEKNGKRFYSLVKRYAALMSDGNLSIQSSADIRSLYDEILLKEIVEEDQKDEPDGEIFRKGHVDVISPTMKVIHTGLYPESEIIRSMDKAVSILNDREIEPLFRIAVFHYLFGYIHPFYNGNGRLNRFISSCYLSETLESIMAYRLSYTIKENIHKYYRSFKIVNDEHNKGDVTPFIFVFLDLVKESSENLRNGLKKKYEDWVGLSGMIEFLPDGRDEKLCDLYHYLLQASLFSDIGISTSELLELLQISRPTLQKRLHLIESHGLLITEKRNYCKYYQLNIDEVNSLSGQ